MDEAARAGRRPFRSVGTVKSPFPTSALYPSPISPIIRRSSSGSSAAWLAHSVRDAGVVGSNPTSPTMIFLKSSITIEGVAYSKNADRQIKGQLNGRIQLAADLHRPEISELSAVVLGPDDFPLRHLDAVHGPGFLIFDLTKSPAYLGLRRFRRRHPDLALHALRRRRGRPDVAPKPHDHHPVGDDGPGLSHRRPHVSPIIRPWHIIVLAFGFGVTNAFDAPPRQALVQELVHTDDMTNAIALNATMFNTGVALGPAVGGLTYALFGPAWCFMINGLSFIAVIAALAADEAPAVRPRGRIRLRSWPTSRKDYTTS